MPQKVVKVYLTPEQKHHLEWICLGLGMDESEVLRQASTEYAKSTSLITEILTEKSDLLSVFAVVFLS